MDLFKTAIPIFGRPETYSEMLMKLAGFVFWECVIGFSILAKNEDFDKFLESSPLSVVPKDALPDGLNFLNPTIIILALLVSFLFYFLQMHNIAQKPFKLRARFDKKHIFLPLAKLVGKSPQSEKVKRFDQKRNTVMQELFYRYASSTKSDPVVDRHNIVQALWLWSMFWALEEGALVFGAFAITFSVSGLRTYAYVFGGICVICLLLMPTLWPRLSRAARAQVEQIAADADAKQHVRKTISAL